MENPLQRTGRLAVHSACITAYRPRPAEEHRQWASQHLGLGAVLKARYEISMLDFEFSHLGGAEKQHREMQHLVDMLRLASAHRDG